MVSKLREGALSPTGRKFADTVHSKIEELRKELLLGVVKENVSMFRITVGRGYYSNCLFRGEEGFI